MDEVLDPSITALAKAIGKSESGGNYTAKGKSGEYGAYQFTKPTWTTWAGKFLGDPNAEMTPENQDKVAYSQIKEWGSQGYKPAQIASLWNSGKPDWEGNVGTNKFGVKYDTPAYVQSVGKAYEELNKGQDVQPDQSNPSNVNAPQQSFLDALLSNYTPESIGRAFSQNAGSAIPAALGAATGAGVISGAIPGVVSAIGAGVSSLPALAGGFLKLKGAEALDQNVAGALGMGGQAPSQPQVPGASPAQPQADPMAELNALSQSQAASKTLRDTLSQQMGTTQSGRDFLDSEEGKRAVETAAHYGYAPEVDENGILNSTPALEKLRANQKDLVNLEKKIAGEGSISTLSAANEAGKYMASAKEMANLTPKEREQVGNLAREEIMSYGHANRPMSIQSAIDARHQQYAATRGKYGEKTSVQIAAHKVAAAGFRNAVKNASKNPESYEKLLKEEQKHINAERLLRKVHNKRALQNNNIWKSFLKGSARYAETYIGEKLGGALGAVAGLMIGEHLNRKIDKKFGKTLFETAGMRAAMDTLKDAKPDVYKKIVEEMKAKGIDADLNEPGESPEVPGTRVGIREDIQKNMAVMDKSKEGLIKLKNPGALTRSGSKSPSQSQSKGLPAT